MKGYEDGMYHLGFPNEEVKQALNRIVMPALTLRNGEQVKSDDVITPELQAKIDSAREEYRKGNFVSCSTADDLRHYLNSL